MTDKYPQEHLQKRLTTGLGVLGGAKGSLTKCVGRLGSLKRALHSGVDTTSVSDAVELLERELQMTRVELCKLLLSQQRHGINNNPNETDPAAMTDNENSNKDIAESADLIAKEEEAVKKLRQELRQASATVAAKEEYEQMAKLLIAKHPTPTHVLESEIKQLESELDEATKSANLAKQQMQLRQSQFQLLMQCMLDLKQSLKYDEEVGLFVPDTPEQKGTSEPSAKKAKTQQIATTMNKQAKQDVKMATEEEDDEEGALYDDL